MALKPGQLTCINTLDKPIVVAAGAGSGKTFTLTKRIVGAFESGFVDDIGQVCAITFTNKAAAELKSRVKSELRDNGFVEQSLKADDAWISTIHGMCSRILRAHAVELDIDPAFKMADSAQVDQFLDEAVEAVLVDAEIDDAQAITDLFSEYAARSSGFGSSSVQGMLRRLVEAASANPRGADAFVLADSHVNAAQLATVAVNACDDLAEAVEREKSSSRRDAWLAGIAQPLADAHRGLEDGSAADPMNALRLLAGLRVYRNFGSKAFKAFAAECGQTIETCIMELRMAAAAPHLQTLAMLARDALARFAARKRREGVLDNNDLLVLVARAMEEHPDIAAAYANKFKLVMVDEFQDTDQMQVDMIKRIAGPGAVRLCTVGDAQQSIYRFRGADVSVYRRHLNAVRSADPDGVIMLPDNFRSHADVLALVDRVFEQPSMFGGEFMSLAPGRDEALVQDAFAADVPRIRVLQTTKAYSKGVPASEVTREQARRVAREFAELRDAGHPAGSMAVLLGRMTNAGVYAQALREQGLPCVVSGGSVFKDTPEAQMVLDLTRVAANPRNTESLWNVLVGPMFRVSDEEILAMATSVDDRDGYPRRRKLDAGLRAIQALFRQEDAAPAVSAQLQCAVRVLGSLLRGVGRSTMSHVLMRAVVDSGWITRLESAGPEGLASAGNVYKGIRMVEDIERAKTLGPVGVMRALDQILKLAKEAPGALSTTGGDFVRIMTVHASKGLEFPIVAVADMKDPGGDSSKLLTLGDGTGNVMLSLDLGRSLERIGGLASAMKPAEGVYPMLLDGLDDEDALLEAARAADGALKRRAAIYEHGRLGEEEESKRLLYVALTRARECLVISIGGQRTKDNPNGIPDNCLGAVVSALTRTEEGFEPGISSYEFGGSMPARVEHRALVREEAEASGTEAAEAERPEAEAQPSEPELFRVPAATDDPWITRIPHADAHTGIFSYSSVAESSHEGDLLERLAGRHAVKCDEALQEAPWLEPDAPDRDAFLAQQRWEDRLAAMGDEDDGSWAYLGSHCADADKATDLGTAFHRLAQYAVEARKPAGPLQPPPAERERMLVRTCRLDGRQWSRLDEALERWFGSEEAALMARWENLHAEVPFFIPICLPAGDEGLPIAAGESPVFLEGEIDLLATDEAGMRARVVDYKTGGNPAESRETLERKHVLQASCYAYSLLLQGFQEVEASFVRVERPRADKPSEPQCVGYRFMAADAPALERAIAQAYALANGVA